MNKQRIKLLLTASHAFAVIANQATALDQKQQAADLADVIHEAAEELIALLPKEEQASEEKQTVLLSPHANVN